MAAESGRRMARLRIDHLSGINRVQPDRSFNVGRGGDVRVESMKAGEIDPAFTGAVVVRGKIIVLDAASPSAVDGDHGRSQFRRPTRQPVLLVSIEKHARETHAAK
jgi:hypothetical protein